DFAAAASTSLVHFHLHDCCSSIRGGFVVSSSVIAEDDDANAPVGAPGIAHEDDLETVLVVRARGFKHGTRGLGFGHLAVNRTGDGQVLRGRSDGGGVT